MKKDEILKIDWKKPVWIQPKMNSNFCGIEIVDGEVSMISGNGELSRKSSEKLNKDLNGVFPGETIKVEGYLMNISDPENVQFFVSDIQNNDEFEINNRKLLGHPISNVFTVQVGSQEEILRYHKSFLEAGYDGTIIKNCGNSYTALKNDFKLGNDLKQDKFDIRGKKVSLVLGGGGAKGLAHIGVLKRIEEAGGIITEISGNSMGALIGGFYASGLRAKEIEEIAKGIGLFEMSKYLDLSFWSNGVLKGNKIEKFLKDTLKVENIEDCNMKFSCNAFDLRSGKEVIFRKGSMALAIRSSISLPHILEPVKNGDSLLIDGGIKDPLPIKNLVSDDTIIIVSNVLGGITLKETSKLQILISSVNSTLNSLADCQLAREKFDLLINPDLSSISLLEFYNGEKISNIGYGEAKSKF